MFTVGPLTFHLYGLLIGLGVLAAGWQASKYHKGIWDALVWVVGWGLVGARLYHVIDQWDYYWLRPGEIIMLWQGGLGIYGGIAGGLIGLWLYAKNKNKFWQLADAGVMGLPLGQAIGRWGNYFNQELYGRTTDLPWGIIINGNKYHPLFLYESLWCVLIWLILKKINYKLGKGKMLAAYLGLYGLGRFWLEFLRIESWHFMGIDVAQGISVGLMVGAIIFLKQK